MNDSKIYSIAHMAISKHAVTAADVKALRDAIVERGFITRAEADALITLELKARTRCDAWEEVFVEALTAHLVWECRPTGRVKDADAAWLEAALRGPRANPTPSMAALLDNVVREAVEVEPSLMAMAARADRGACAVAAA